MKAAQSYFYWRVYRSTRTGHYTWLGVRSNRKAMTHWEGARRLAIFKTGRTSSVALSQYTAQRRLQKALVKMGHKLPGV